MSISALIMRRMFAKGDAQRDAGLTIPEDVAYVRDLRYGSHPSYHLLDLCWPRDAQGKLPVIVSFHGGGYVYGSKEVYQFYCASLAQRGFAVVNFNYRLAPKFKFPSPLEDLGAVLAWLLAHRDEYPVDPENLFLVGDSAGAQMASQYAAIWASPAYQRVMGITPPPVRLAAVGLNCGMYDMAAQRRDKGLDGVKRDYFTAHPEQFGEKLNVLAYIDGNYPPVSIFSAGGDFLLPHCEPMAELLRSRGVDCDCHIYGDQSVGHVFHCNMRLDIGRQANDDQTAFFRRYLR